MNRLLAIETSSEACSVALADGESLHEQHTHAPLGHAELLLPAVRSVMDRSGLRFRDLDAIVFGRGPGSFTSLRIGIGVVQGLAWGTGLPVVPVSSLAAVAQQVMADGAADIVVAMDARMDEVFSARYRVGRAGLVRVGEERVGAPGEVVVESPGTTVGCGNGFERYPELRQLARLLKAAHADCMPRASALIPLARVWLENHEPLPADQAQPVYIRDKVAEKP